MINLFTFASNDQSISYLAQIFGPMNGVLQSGTGITLLGTMFKTFNSVILAVGALMIVYVTIVGVMATAHEGEFMGKKWNNIWIPIRMVLGIAALVPTGSGFSAIQIVMMWVIAQGIGAADTLWNTVLGYVSVTGSPYGQVTIPSVGAYNTFSTLYQGLVCAASASVQSQDPSGLQNGGYFCTGSRSGYCGGPLYTKAVSGNSIIYTLGPGGACGTLTFCNPDTACSGNSNSLQCVSCQAQAQAMESIVPTLAGIAQQFVQVDYQYRSFYYTSGTQPASGNWSWIYSYCSAQNPPIPQSQCCNPSATPTLNPVCKATTSGQGNPNLPDPNLNKNPQNPSTAAVKNLYLPFGMANTIGTTDFINTSTTYYVNTITAAVSTFIQQQGVTGGALSGQLADAAALGWIFAGSYYYAIAKTNNNNLQNAVPTLTFTLPEITTSIMNNYRNNVQAAAALESGAAGPGGIFGSNDQLSGMGSALGAAGSSVVSSFAQNQSSGSTSGGGGTSPLTAVQITGAVMILVASITYPVLLAITFVLGIFGFFNFYSLGTGITNPSGGTFALTYFILVPALFAFLGILVALGGTLAIYVPLIPYVVFTFGAIGWLTTVVEAMVAGPLVALGILSPSGQHELLGKAEPALMLLFDVFLRPSLMIFGLIAAMLLATVVVSMINAAFWTTVVAGIFGPVGSASTTSSGAQAEGWIALATNPLELIIYLSAYVALLVAALNKCFQAIYLVPQGVMKWISGQAAQYGEHEAVGAAKEAVTGATGQAKAGMEGGTKMSERGGHAGGMARGKDPNAPKSGGGKVT